MRILVANRGAIARRVIQACSGLGFESVAVYSACDDQSPYLQEATSAHALPGFHARDTYLNVEALLKVARESGADAVHPGYGFLAENADFAQAVIDADLKFIGPDPVWLRRMGDKVAARALMSEQGFPAFAGSGLITSTDQARSVAEEIGYPIMVKPSAGGGGMGMQAVHSAQDLGKAIHQAEAIGSSAFGDGGVYLERLIENPRHIEFQILADGQGRATHVFERECSVQRRHQKLIEESPAPNIPADQILKQARLAEQICANLGYNNVGTLETLFAKDGSVGFLEMNTRIQVEHGVTEMITGLDLVQTQIELALGEPLPAVPRREGFAIEARLYAEDAQTMLPSTGMLRVFRPPKMHGVRIDTGYRQGQAVTPYYDAMLAKVIAFGTTREMAIGRLSVALRAFEVQGVQTNAALLQRVLGDARFLRGDVDTSLVHSIVS